MEKVARFSVSLDRKLLRELDRMAREKGHDNRSLADAMLAAKGVKLGQLTTTTGKNLPA